MGSLKVWLGTQRLGRLNEAAAHAALEVAGDAGVAWLDTAPIYGSHDGAVERLVAPFLTRHPGVRVATKGGLVRDGKVFRPDGRAQVLIAAAEASLERLGRIDLWQLHAPDPRVAFGTTLRAMARLLDRGTVRALGLCNVTVGQLRDACDTFPVSAVQVEVSPLAATAVRSGVVEEALTRGIPVLAYRPLAGADRVERLLAHPEISRLAALRATSPARVVLAWLASFGLVPLPGPSRADTVRDALGYPHAGLTPADLHLLDGVFPVGRLRVRRTERAPSVTTDREVLVVMGSPGSGKSTHARTFESEGWLRLNRDDRGGTLEGLLAPLDGALADGARRVVLDNTYPTRAARNGVVETAWAHGVPIRCVWLTTDDATCEVNVVRRILDRRGSLPEPDVERAGDVLPRALHRYREQLEPPAVDEGFTRVEKVPWTPRPDPEATRGALVVDPAHLDRSADVIRSALADGVVLLGVGWAPGAPPDAEREVRARAEEGGWPLADVRLCRHPAGPPRCWCRKPLPGLVVQLFRTHHIAAERSRMVVVSAADRTLAAKLGLTPIPASDVP